MESDDEENKNSRSLESIKEVIYIANVLPTKTTEVVYSISMETLLVEWGECYGVNPSRHSTRRQVSTLHTPVMR